MRKTKANLPVLIFGAGGHGKVVLDILLSSEEKVTGFLDDDKAKHGQKINGFKILGDLSFIRRPRSYILVLGIGNNLIREKIFNQAKAMGIAIASALHPCSIIARDVEFGEGVVVMPGAIINSGSILADGVVINTAASVDHDCQLERFCQVWPGAHLAGTVKVGEYSYVGTGAAVIQNIMIGRQVMIGAGAVVVKDIPDRVTAVGVPAKIVKRG